MPEERDCFVKLVVDDHGVEHSVKVRAESVYEVVEETRTSRLGATSRF